MQFFKRLSIQHKLAIIIMATSTLVLLISSAVFLYSEIVSFRRSAVNQVTSLAGIIAASGRLPLRFNDFQTIEEILTPLGSEPGIVLGLVYNRSDQAMARYLRPGESLAELGASSREIGEQMPQILASGQAFQSFHHGYLDVVVPVLDRGEKIGAVYLRSDLGLLRQQLIKLVIGSLAVLGASFLVAGLLSFRLQRFISHPLLQLVRLMETISREKDFTIRGEKTTDDEIGTLIDGFNGMLAQIESRDQELARHRQSLEEQVRLRTHDLNTANEQLNRAIIDLAQARDAAEQASQAKSLFLANMSHEIRTPMVGVLGMTELMMKSGLSEQQRAMAGTVYRSGEALLTILNDILDFSKIEAGKLELEKIEFDLAEVVEEAVVLLAEKGYAKGVEVILELPSDPPPRLLGDPGRLRQIVLNLVSNAIKFTDHGEVALRLSCLRETRRELVLQIEVEDTGIGIEPEVQQRIFDSFSQADNSTSRRFGGTGLGLSIVRELVHLMGGEMAVASEPEKGSTFRLSCRLEKAKVRRVPTVSPGFPPELKGARAVLAMPNATARGALRHQLTALGLPVQGA
ncbi:MAG: HAMP domain-containing protein, partial [Desulfuromonadales bacterium]|nr:HAMP domain-containing protein [Desulfuromonadales bacterium]